MPSSQRDLNDNEPLPRLTTTALAGIVIVLGVWLFVAKASQRMPDFEVYWRAGTRAAAAEPIYRASDADYQLKYFPAFAIVAIPLGLMPLDTAKATWFALSAAALLALFPLSLRLLHERRQPAWLLIAVLLIGLGKYYAEDLVLGQINTVVMLVAACAILALNRGREALAGVLVAIAIVLKPYALILAPWLVARRRWPSIVALAIGLLIACVLPAGVYGVDGTLDLYRGWWHTVTSTTDGTLLHSDNVSLASLWAKRLGIGSAAATLATVNARHAPGRMIFSFLMVRVLSESGRLLTAPAAVAAGAVVALQDAPVARAQLQARPGRRRRACHPRSDRSDYRGVAVSVQE